MSQSRDLSLEEVVELGAADPVFFAHYFFPKAFRQGTPEFHQRIWDDLDDPRKRYVAIEVFRGGAKTTLLRAYTARRIAYGISRTILFVSEAQNHAIRSVEWLKRNIKFNARFSQAFQLRVGGKDAQEELEIVNELAQCTIRVIALGITGQTRGVNVEDYRPDLIVVDDPCDEENTATAEQRKKISDLFFGALAKSLAPRSESPNAKMVLLQTPLHREDLVESCMRDPQWASHRYGCFDEKGESRWPERWSTEELEAEKKAHIERGQLALWLREMECRIVSEESASFRHEWLQYWDVLPEGGVNVLTIDPVPPPSDRELAKGLANKDFEVLHVWKSWRGKRFLCERVANRGHDPEWTIAEFFRLAIKWKVLRVGVESVAYQRTLAWLLRKAMQARKTYFVIEEINDKRKKRHRIEQAFSGRGAAKQVFVHPSHTPFIEQWDAYPDVAHDDELDCGAMAQVLLDELSYLDEYESGDESYDEPLAALPQYRRAP